MIVIIDIIAVLLSSMVTFNLVYLGYYPFILR